jgi:GH25 family lysozyme M1 (1,4-beta-N-acetylmuramidase)
MADMTLVDVSHWQLELDPSRPNHRLMDWDAAVATGLVGAIVKYTQGTNGRDALAYKHSWAAYQAKVPLLGCYHFGSGSDGEIQANNFLDYVHGDYGPDLTGLMLMLDAEQNPGNQMTVKIAERFVLAIHEAEGRWPWIYMGKDGPEGNGNGLPSEILSQCPLLVAAYGPHDQDLGKYMPRGFSMPTDTVARAGICRAWQFTDGTHHGGPFPGLGRVDQSKFIGIETLDQARAIWAS